MNSAASMPRLPWEREPYSVKQHGVTITDCDTEPVQTPGCIQDHGVLFVLRRSDLNILQVSENVHQYFDFHVPELLGQPIRKALGDGPEKRFLEVLASETLEQNPLHVCTLQLDQAKPRLEVTIHTTDEVVVVECERAVSHESENVLDHYRFMKSSIARLQAAGRLSELCDLVCDEIRSLTRLDRVMIYKFHSDDHGEVIAESRRDDLPTWVGLHYPAEDIPEPARSIFRQIWIRPVVDIDSPLAELVPLVNPDTGRPLTMTHCALRAPSVMYTEYLRNMGVRASLTMPIRRDGKLWGLIAAHHYSGPALIPYQLRAACEHLAQVVSLQHKAVTEREHFLDRLQLTGMLQQLVARAAREGGLQSLTTGSPNLLDVVNSTGSALFHLGRWWCIGTTPEPAALDELSTWLTGRFGREPTTNAAYATNKLSREYPPAAAFQASASGLLALNLSRHGKHLILWFRPETIQTVKWGGNPHEMPMIPGPHGARLTPRKSFEVFAESVVAQSIPWRNIEIEAVLYLREFILEFVLERAEQLSRLNEELTRSNDELDAFAYVASHDLKEPLRGIHKYAHQLGENPDTSSDEYRKKLDGLMQLAVRMDTLLDSLLHFARVGRVTLQMENVDLQEVVNEALEMVASRRRERPTEIVVPRPLQSAWVDHVRIREVFVNLISNALKYNDSNPRIVEIGYILPLERTEVVQAPPGTTDQVIYYVRDNGIGIQAKHFEQIFKIFRRLHPRDQYGGGAGVGLTITKKVIERHRGRIWLQTNPNMGTTFYFTIGGEPNHAKL